MLEKILDMVATNGYIKYITKDNFKYLKIGPTGLLLQNNLKNQWCNNVVMNKDITVFPNKGNILDTFEHARKLCLDKVPFGIAETIKPVVGKRPKSTENKETETKLRKFGNLFEEDDQFVLKSTIFVPSETSVQFFHQWQKQRRMWWRKVSH